jgi:pimeloyl-ACP methyl ester carboxylesterase/DNA-binding CsgD family transcriptional regulator
MARWTSSSYPGWVSNVEVFWEEPACVRFFERLASFSRLILFDKRGTGLSDRVADLPTLEQRMDDVRAVMDAAGSRRAALYGYSEGGPMCALFAATYPARTTALVMDGTFARAVRADDYPWGPTEEERLRRVADSERNWGGPVGLDRFAPSRLHDGQFSDWWARFLRLSASPGAAAALARMNIQIDIRPVLPSIHVPTLILHRSGDRTVDVHKGRHLAQHIPGAKYVELPGIDHEPFTGDMDATLDEVEAFLTGVRRGPDPERVLATLLVTEIAAATERAAVMGDRRWRELEGQYHTLARRELARYRGREVEATGEGFLATFDGPARAICCATAVSAAVRQLGIEIRAGLHTGEVELLREGVTGIAVRIGARVAAEARPGEVLVSSTVKDLVAGSGLGFRDRGLHILKGIPGEWRLFAVESNEPAGSAVPVTRYPDGLSEREVQVLCLIARGRSNSEIAEELVLSVRTVEHHIARIYPKIGARGRADATSYALRHDLH